MGKKLQRAFLRASGAITKNGKIKPEYLPDTLLSRFVRERRCATLNFMYPAFSTYGAMSYFEPEAPQPVAMKASRVIRYPRSNGAVGMLSEKLREKAMQSIGNPIMQIQVAKP